MIAKLTILSLDLVNCWAYCGYGAAVGVNWLVKSYGDKPHKPALNPCMIGPSTVFLMAEELDSTRIQRGIEFMGSQTSENGKQWEQMKHNETSNPFNGIMEDLLPMLWDIMG